MVFGQGYSLVGRCKIRVGGVAILAKFLLRLSFVSGLGLVRRVGHTRSLGGIGSLCIFIVMYSYCNFLISVVSVFVLLIQAMHSSPVILFMCLYFICWVIYGQMFCVLLF